MGAESSQSVRQTLCQRNSETFLRIYEPISEAYDQSLGKLKILRKKQYNFDYVGVVDKLMEKEYVSELRNMLKIGDSRGSETKHPQKQRNYTQSNGKDTGHLWVRVFACEVYPTESEDANYCHVRICLEYYNFTLRDYLNIQSQTLQPHKIIYILSSILACYHRLLNLAHRHPINTIPLINSITTPSLIFIDIEGCLKFLPIPIFMLTDYVTNVDKCMINCCRFEGEGNYQYRNIVIPKFGRSTDKNVYEQDSRFVKDGKMDKLFISRLKKLIKYMKNASMTTESSMKNSQQHQAKTQSNSYIHLQMPSNKYQPASYRKQQQIWNQLEQLNSIQQFNQYLSNIPNKIQSLQFDKSPEIKNRHPVPIPPKQPAAKLQKFKLKNNQQCNNHTIDSNYTNNNSIHYSTQYNHRDRNTHRQQQETRSNSASVRHQVYGQKGQRGSVLGQQYHYL